MTSRPPMQGDVEAFINAANELPNQKTDTENTPEEQPAEAKPVAKQAKQKKKKSYPWEDEKVREDVNKYVNLRLPEPYLLKLKYLSEQTNKSQQVIIREHLLPALDKEIKELDKK